MTTPEEEFKKAVGELGAAFDEFINQARANITQLTMEITEQLRETRQKLEDAQVDRIVAQNPGINPEEVRASVRRTQDS